MGDQRHERLRADRRRLLHGAIGLLAAPLLSRAKSDARVPLVVIVRTTADSPLAAQFEIYREALRELGYVDGKSVRLDNHIEPGGADFDAAAKRAVQLGADAIFAVGTPAALAARRATQTIPIVFYAADPVGTGLVASLARPGANATGIASMAEETSTKRLQFMKELRPRGQLFGLLANPDNPATARQLVALKSTADVLGVKLRVLEVRRQADLEQALSAIGKARLDAVVVVSDPILNANQKLLARYWLDSKIPSIAAFRGFAEAGGLMSFGPDYRDLLRRCAAFTARVLKGVRPADLPIEQPTKFELVVNEKTAKTIGLALPDSILLRADEVIK